MKANCQTLFLNNNSQKLLNQNILLHCYSLGFPQEGAFAILLENFQKLLDEDVIKIMFLHFYLKYTIILNVRHDSKTKRKALLSNFHTIWFLFTELKHYFMHTHRHTQQRDTYKHVSPIDINIPKFMCMGALSDVPEHLLESAEWYLHVPS